MTNFMSKIFSVIFKNSKWLLTGIITVVLLLTLVNLIRETNSIDLLNITQNNSNFTIKSSYIIDSENKSVTEILSKNNFIPAKLNKIPYELKDQSYWIKITLRYPVNRTFSPKYLDNEHLILLAEHSMLKQFDVYELNALDEPILIFNKAKSENNNVQLMYPHAKLMLNQFGHSQYIVHVKNAGPPQIPLLLFKPLDFEKRLSLSQLVYGAFVGVLLIMAIYNIVLFFAEKDKVYLFYIGYLLSAFAVLSSLTGFGYFIFPNNINLILNHYLIFFDFLLILFLLLFTLYFLRYERLNQKAYKLTLIIAGIISAVALYSLFLDEIAQTKLFFSMQPLFYIIALFLILNRLKHDFSWAKFYFLSWIPFLTGAVIQPLVLLNQLEYSFFTRNAFLFAVMVEVTFMAFALAGRIRKNEEAKLSMIAYHPSNHIPRKTNLDHTVNVLIEHRASLFTVLVIKPEQFSHIIRYIDESTHIAFFQNLNRKLSSLFRFNDAILSITNKNEKLCFLENNCLAMVINNRTNQQDLNLVIQSIQSTVNEVYSQQSLQLPLSAHVGLAKYPEHGNSSEVLIKHAATAANQAKLSPQKWSYFTDLNDQNRTTSMQLAMDLSKAIKQKSFSLFHQPQIDLKTGMVCSSECLLRWEHPVLDMVSPEVFIPIAEDFGLMPSLTLWVIETALAQQQELKEQTGLNHMISINISGKDITQLGFIDEVTKRINASSVKAEKIIFELTESISFSENAQAITAIEELISLGITISIDDFGTGYSSMAQINHLPFQELKIDRQFVENVCDDNKRKVIAQTTVKMAKGLGLEVVAEGINSLADEQALRDFGCDIGQGYYYAKPMPLEEYIVWLNNLDNGHKPASLEGEFIPANK